MRWLLVVILALLVSSNTFGQTYTISTFAGGALPINIPGTSASLYPNDLQYIAADQSGNVFFEDHNTVLRLDATTGILTNVAGNGTAGFSGDNGPATSAQLNGPTGIAIDSAGNLYIADRYNARVRKVSNGVISTVAGNGVYGFGGDNGPATSAELAVPTGVAVDSAGNLYIADIQNDRIRKVSNGVITSVAGNGTCCFSGDNGPATSAQLAEPYGVTVDSAGNLYIADSANYRIRRVSNGVITTVAGNGTCCLFGGDGDNGPATNAQLYFPTGITVNSAGNLYIADGGNNRIRKVANGVITTVAGVGTCMTTTCFSGDNGPATSAELDSPDGVAVDAAGNLYITDTNNGRIRKVANGVITTVGGNGVCCSFSGDNGPATSAQLDFPTGVAVDSAGNAYISDQYNDRIRKVSDGVITTVAGGGSSLGDNGPATSAVLGGPLGVAVDSAGNVYVADTVYGRIRKVANGIITTIAGGGSSLGDNGPATSAQLVSPAGVAVDSAGSLYIADYYAQRVRKVANGIITTVAGNGTQGFSGDNGPATSAQLSRPYSVAVDAADNLYIAELSNNRIRKVANGIITTAAGSGTPGFSGDNGPATSAQLDNPTGVAVDSAGNLYIADAYNARIRKVANGVITTVAGGGAQFGDNGPATSAQLSYPEGVAVDFSGNVFVADAGNSRIRLLTPSGATTPPLSVSGVANAASNLSGPIAPGEIVVMFGSGLGPAQLTSAHIGSDGLYDAQLAGTSVQFNGTPSPIIYTSATQVAAIVPYEITGASAQVTVTYEGQTSAVVTAAVAASVPGLFTLDSTGKGQAAVVNQNGSINTAATPAKVGDVISLYATGEGQTSSSGVDGKPTSAPYPHPIVPVSVTIGGQTVSGSQLEYAGEAPGEVAGVMQVNVQIPSGIQTGSAVPVSVQVGSASSQPGVTIAVQ